MSTLRKNTLRFIAFLLLAGCANLLSRIDQPVFGKIMTASNALILFGLLLFWLQSVRMRLLPSGARRCVVAIVLLLLLWLMLRTVKYQIAGDSISKRYLAYAYWIPQMLTPSLFLMSCIRIRRGNRPGRWDDRLLLIPGSVLSVLVITNDLHQLIYKPNTGFYKFALDTGTYTLGPVFYLLYIWMIVTMLSGVVLLFRETGHRPGKVIRSLLLVVLLWFSLVMLDLLVIEKITLLRFFNIPEIHIFCIRGIIEVYIRHRLIRYNENYSGFFRNLRMPVLITDRRFRPLYASASPIRADQEKLLASLTGPVALSMYQKLYGSEIRGGYAFRVEDESAVSAAQQRLLFANSLMEQENDLIRAETEQKEKDAHLQSRHRIYHEIAGELYPWQKRIGRMLDEAEPGSEDFRDKIARISVLNAYVKRKTNLLLLASENETLRTGELYLALQESANYLTLAGLPTTVAKPEDVQKSAEQLTLLYDAFEQLAEQLLGKASSMMVAWNEDGLCLATQADQAPDPVGLPLPVRFRSEEDTLYMDLSAEKGGASA